MKKLFLVFAALSLFITTQAQVFQMLPKTPVTVGGVTPGYDTLAIPYAQTKCGSFQVNVTRVTSAMVGTIQLQASNDGVNWTNTATADTVHISNAASQVSFLTIAPATGILYYLYRVKVTQNTGDTVTIKSWFNGRQ